MIIHSIQAQDFMKFRSLRLVRLPPRGLVGIVGDNESGKTTVGHAILFSLFGEAPEGDLMRLIHWDADQMKIAMEFTAEGYGTFVIYREIDRRGTNYVRLRNKEDEKDACSGIIAVGDRLGEMLGVTAEEFKVSFFMSQKDVDFLRPGRDGPSPILDRILGLHDLLELARSAESSLEDIRRGVAQISEELKVRESIYQGSYEDPERELLFIKDMEELKKDVERVAREVNSLGHSEKALAGEIARREEGIGGLEALRTVRHPDQLLEGVDDLVERDEAPLTDAAVSEALGGVAAERKRMRAPLDTLRDYIEHLGNLRGLVGEVGEALYIRIREEAEKSRLLGKAFVRHSRWARRTGFLTVLFLVLALASAAWWVVAARTYPPDKIIGTFAGGPEWSRDTLLIGLGALFGFSVVLSYFLGRNSLRMSARRAEEERLKKEAEDNLRELEERRAFCVSFGERGADLPVAELEDLGDSGVSAGIAALQAAHPELSSEGHASSPLWDDIAQAGGRIREALEEARQSAASDRAVKEDLLRERKAKLRDVEESLAGFRQKQEMLKSLGEEKETLERDLLEARHQAKVHETLAREAREAAQGMRGRFGPALARFLKPILPQVTRGRYSNVRVGPDLSVKVFSTDKNDFLSLNELSGGTLEQLLLAVRLGLSQALILSRGSPDLGAQFLFLDEPFPSSDRLRSTQFARLLHEMGAFAQVFVTTQAREVIQEGYDLIVETRLESSELVVTGTSTATTTDDPPPIDYADE